MAAGGFVLDVDQVLMKLADQGSTLPGQGSGTGQDLGSPAGHQEELVDEGFPRYGGSW